MSGILDLQQLLVEMNPILHHEEYVFCTFPDALYGDYADLQPVAAVQEGEGLTLIIPREVALEREIPVTATFKLITLMVHSSLEAVGLTAVVATRLAEAGISANVVAGFYHDHIFVPAAAGDRALQALTP